jgi:hypothetical protein
MDNTQLSKAQKVKVTHSSAFSDGPCYGLLEGEPVTITHVGDAEGMSPVYLVIDTNGRSAWVAQDSVVITDQRFLPTSAKSAIETGQERVPAGSFGSPSR